MIGWLVGWMIGWLVGWMIGWISNKFASSWEIWVVYHLAKVNQHPWVIWYQVPSHRPTHVSFKQKPTLIFCSVFRWPLSLQAGSDDLLGSYIMEAHIHWKLGQVCWPCLLLRQGYCV
jgi:hypothetical protein